MSHHSLSEPCKEDNERNSRIHNLWCGAMAMGLNGTSRTAAVETNSSFADTTPLLGKDRSIAVNKIANSKKRGLEIEGPIGVDDVSRVTLARIFKSALAILAAAASLAVSILLLIVSPAIVEYVMGGMCILNFTLVTCSEWRILLSGSE